MQAVPLPGEANPALVGVLDQVADPVLGPRSGPYGGGARPQGPSADRGPCVSGVPGPSWGSLQRSRQQRDLCPCRPDSPSVGARLTVKTNA